MVVSTERPPRLGEETLYDIQSKIVLIVGGTDGIGLATAKAFAAEDAVIVLAGRNTERGRRAKEALNGLGREATFIQCDVGDPSAVDRLLNLTIEQFGKVDCAVNSAGYDFKPSRAHELQSQSVSDQLAIDFTGVFSCMRAEVTAMLPRGGGTIVNVASTTGLSGTPTAALYSAAKHAVIGLTRSTAREYIADGIRINAVCPGITDTSRRERGTAHLDESELFKLKVEVASEIPIGRVARADEIAQAILWLSSPSSSYVVGHSLVVDGGLTA
jgi:NAD(P)-dependent dehydrogenase (short-subunit alcohol dehydrogenase family)